MFKLSKFCLHGSFGNLMWELCITRSLESITHNHLTLLLIIELKIYLIKNSKFSIKIYFYFISKTGYLFNQK
jgi:hypothetical protein